MEFLETEVPMNTTRGLSCLAAVLAAGLTLQCESHPEAPESGVEHRPSFARHPLGTTKDSVALTGMPFAVAVSQYDVGLNDGVVYVAQLTNGTIAKTTLPAETFTTFSIGSPTDPSQVRISPNGQTAYVNDQYSKKVKWVTVATNSIFDSVAFAKSPLNIGLSPNGTRLYVLTDSDGVYVLDALSSAQQDHIAVATTGYILSGVAFHPYMLRMYITPRDSGKVLTFNTETDAFMQTNRVTGSRIQNVAVSRDGTQLFATDIQNSKLLVWTLLSNGLPNGSPQTYAIGATIDSAFDVAVTADNQQLYVGALHTGNVYVLDETTRSLINTIPAHGRPRYIAFDWPGGIAVIPNESGWVNFIH